MPKKISRKSQLGLPLPTPDNSGKRRFSTSERLGLFIGSGGACESCGKALGADFHADHKLAYSEGGRTEMRNGAALCPKCNIAKSNKKVPRQWQQNCMRALTQSYARGEKSFLVEATPGSGKTAMALLFGKEGLMKPGLVEQVVVICPSRALKRQWVKEAGKFDIPLRSNLTNVTISAGEMPSDVVGYVATYAQVAASWESHAASVNRRNTLVILDEIHHAGDDLSWGSALVDAFEGAEFRLLLSGTPFRSDNAQIPFVRYENGKSAPNYRYGYGEALRDKVCRKLVFVPFNGEMEWLSGAETIIASFDDDLGDRDDGRRLRTSIHPKGKLPRRLIRAAHKRLLEIRKTKYDGKAHTNAAGIVFADDQESALAYAALIKSETGQDAVVVRCDDGDSAEKIAAFKESDDMWIVSINMISEGVDISRLRVGVYVTTKRTELFFRQAIARTVRWDSALTSQLSYIYLPKDSKLEEMALRVKAEIDHVLGPDPERRDPGDPDEPREPSDFHALDSEGYETYHIIGSETVSRAELNYAIAEMESHPGISTIPEIEFALYLKEKGLMPTDLCDYEERYEEDELDPDLENKTLRAEIQKIRVPDVVKLLCPGSEDEGDPDYIKERGETYAFVNNTANRACGITDVNIASADQLGAKIAYLKEWLVLERKRRRDE